jgi:hypothetical protein
MHHANLPAGRQGSKVKFPKAAKPCKTLSLDSLWLYFGDFSFKKLSIVLLSKKFAFEHILITRLFLALNIKRSEESREFL